MPKEKPTEVKDVVKFDITKAAIAEMRNQYMPLTIKGIDDKKGFDIVHSARMNVKGVRVAVEKRRKKLKEKILQDGRDLDFDANEIFTLLAPIEAHLSNEEQDIIDERKRIEAEKERKEQKRKDDIRDKIFEVQTMLTGVNVMPLKDLKKISCKLEDINITEQEYMEFTEEAEKVQDQSYEAVQNAITARIKFDQEEADRKKEDERLESLRKQQKEAQAVLAEEKRKIQEAKDELEADKKAEQERKEKEALEKAAKEKAEADTKENARQKAEEAEALAAVKAIEEARQEALKPDKEKLINFANYLLEIRIPINTLQSEIAKQIISDARDTLENLTLDIIKKAEKL